MHIAVHGQGPDLVLLHGWAMHGGIFSGLIDALQADFRLHVVDLPGHGHSASLPLPADIETLADDLAQALPTAAWLGWSLGGLCAMQVARRHPMKVHALIALCSTPCFVQRDDWPQGMPAEVFEQFAQGLRSDYPATIDRFLQLEAQGDAKLRETLRWLRAHCFERGQPSTQALSQGLRFLLDCDLRDALPNINAPSRWMAGRRDRLITPAAVQAASALCVRGSFVQFDHGGHAPFITDPDAVAMQIRDFLSGISTERTHGE